MNAFLSSFAKSHSQNVDSFGTVCSLFHLKDGKLRWISVQMCKDRCRYRTPEPTVLLRALLVLLSFLI